MEVDIALEIDRTRQAFRARWAEEWKEKYCRDNKLFLSGTHVPDLSLAPEPPWRTYKEPELVGMRWETGFAVITAEAFRKMSQSQINKLTGGNPHEKRKSVGRR